MLVAEDDSLLPERIGACWMYGASDDSHADWAPWPQLLCDAAAPVVRHHRPGRAWPDLSVILIPKMLLWATVLLPIALALAWLLPDPFAEIEAYDHVSYESF